MADAHERPAVDTTTVRAPERVGLRAGRSTLLATRAAWLGASAFAALAVQSIYYQPVGWAPMALVTVIAVLAAVRPFAALLAVAGLVPFAQILYRAIRTGLVDIDFAEALILALIAACGARHAAAPRRPALSPWLLWSATALAVVGVASAGVQWTVMATENPESVRWGLVPAFLLTDYLISSNHITIAVQFVEGLVVLLITAGLCVEDAGRRRAIITALLAGTMAAAVFTVGRLVAAAWPRDPFLTELARSFVLMRITAFVRDSNAVGSFYALMFFVALGVVQRSRWFGAAAAALAAAGLWMAGSRMALATTFAGLGILGVLALTRRGQRSRASLAAGLAILGLAALVLWLRYPATRNFGTVGWAYATRLELIVGGLRMTASHPIFGVGLGQYYELSNVYAGTMLADQGRERENAHNYFVQVLAELGVVGFVLFAVLLWAILGGAWWSESPPGPRFATVAGLLVFLGTCMSGHPFLTPSVACAFWMVAGASVALHPPIHRHAARVAGSVTILLVALTLPTRALYASRHAYLEHTTLGFSRWQREPDGFRYRFASTRSTLYVPASAKSVAVPLHIGNLVPSIEVRILLDGREVNRVVVEGGDWKNVHIAPIPRSSGLFAGQFVRVDLVVSGGLDVRAEDYRGLLRVGRPTIDQ